MQGGGVQLQGCSLSQFHCYSAKLDSGSSATLAANATGDTCTRIKRYAMRWRLFELDDPRGRPDFGLDWDTWWYRHIKCICVNGHTCVRDDGHRSCRGTENSKHSMDLLLVLGCDHDISSQPRVRPADFSDHRYCISSSPCPCWRNPVHRLCNFLSLASLHSQLWHLTGHGHLCIAVGRGPGLCLTSTCPEKCWRICKMITYHNASRVPRFLPESTPMHGTNTAGENIS